MSYCLAGSVEAVGNWPSLGFLEDVPPLIQETSSVLRASVGRTGI